MSGWNMDDVEKINRENQFQNMTSNEISGCGDDDFQSHKDSELNYLTPGFVNEYDIKCKKRLDSFDTIQRVCGLLVVVCIIISLGSALILSLCNAENDTIAIVAIPAFICVFIFWMLMETMEKVTTLYFKRYIVQPMIIDRLGYDKQKTNGIKSKWMWKKILKHLEVNLVWKDFSYSDCFVGSIQNQDNEKVPFAFVDIELMHTVGSGKYSRSRTDFAGQVFVLPITQTFATPVAFSFSQYGACRVSLSNMDKVITQCVILQENLHSKSAFGYKKKPIINQHEEFSDEFNQAVTRLKSKANGLRLVCCYGKLLFIVQENDCNPFEIDVYDKNRGFDDAKKTLNQQCDSVLDVVMPFVETGIV